MKLLYVSPWAPVPPYNGSRRRIRAIFDRIAARHAVTLITFYRPGEVAPESVDALRCDAVHALEWPSLQGVTLPQNIRAWFAQKPRSTVLEWQREAADLIGRVARAGDFDAAILYETASLNYIDALPTDLPAILEHIQLGWVFRPPNARPWEVRFWRRTVTEIKYRLWLRRVTPRLSLITVASDSDAALARRLWPDMKKVMVMPNGVEDALFGRPKPAQTRPQTLIYNGALTYSANYDAMAWFTRDIWPNVRRECPEAELLITGGTAGVDLSGLSLDESVTLTGYVDDLYGLMESCAGLVVPLRGGAGTRLKVLEALALGVPVVSTPKGVEGLELVPDSHYLRAADSEKFAAQTVQLLKNRALGARLAQAAKDFARGRYGWNGIVDLFTEKLSRLVIRKKD